jgi:ubiquinone/menaquinone biosynthesis C-methylase UbiE
VVTEGLELHVGDGRSLPYPDSSFDVAHCSLVVHHCTPDEADALFREMARVARLGVVVNDLDRRRLGWVGAWLLGHLLTRNRYTRHDAPMSVRRAYRPAEMAAMLRAAGLTPVRTIRGAFGQRYAIAAVPTPDADDPASPPDPQGAGE